MKTSSSRTVWLLPFLLLSPALHGAERPPAKPPVLITNAPAFPLARGSSLQVGPGDHVLFTLPEDPTTSGRPVDLVVDPNGNLRFPICAACPGTKEEIVLNTDTNTLGQLELELKKKLDAAYYKNCTVSLSPGAQAPTPGKIIVTGPIRNNFVQLVPGEHKKL